MFVTTLGTGSPMPDPNRAGPATLVQTAGQNLLFDAGRGVLMRCARAMVAPAMINAMLLTHLHSDHTTDVNDVITTKWINSFVPTPTIIVGPLGTQRFIDRTLATLEDDISYRVHHHADLTWEPLCEVTEVSDGLAYEAEGIKISAFPTDHAPVHPTVGYRIESEGKVVAIAGDTVPCEGLDRLCKDADLYVQTVIRDDIVKNIPIPRLLDILDYHSSVSQAGQTAAKNNVKTLILTHPVPAPQPGTEGEWIAMAQEHFSGTILLADDLMRVEA